MKKVQRFPILILVGFIVTTSLIGGCTKVFKGKAIDMQETFDGQGAWDFITEWDDPAMQLGSATASISAGELYVHASQDGQCARASATLPFELDKDIDEVSRLELTMDYDCGSGPPGGMSFTIQIGQQVFVFYDFSNEGRELEFVWRKRRDHVTKYGGKKLKEGHDVFSGMSSANGSSKISFAMTGCSYDNGGYEYIRVREFSLKVW
jgi:hypothetical protein